MGVLAIGVALGVCHSCTPGSGASSSGNKAATTFLSPEVVEADKWGGGVATCCCEGREVNSGVVTSPAIVTPASPGLAACGAVPAAVPPGVGSSLACAGDGARISGDGGLVALEAAPAGEILRNMASWS